LREPGSTVLGEGLRELVLGRGKGHLDAGVELLLFAAARRQMLREKVEPALAAGRDVVCERFHPSTFAYQAVAGGLDERAVLELLAHWAGEPAPDLVIVIDTAPELAAQRRAAPLDRIEDKGLEFQLRVARGYRRYVELVPATAVVDGRGSPEEVAARIAAVVQRGG
jgi:dTMP kinase